VLQFDAFVMHSKYFGLKSGYPGIFTPDLKVGAINYNWDIMALDSIKRISGLKIKYDKID
jgi:hypothetical protein